MLNVIVGNLSKNRMPRHEILINDIVLYNILNGEIDFEENFYNQDNIELLMDRLVASSKNKDILLHTFNPLFLNYINDDIAKESFIYYDETENKFKKFFEIPEAKRKLKTLAAGDVIADMYITKLI